ncbi:SDR family NAD(P)-dependent oxidoreductase [Natronobiforma cellulositropha]|uniref:SDR family NAD(P)-dependent oxidoreductase n=1 Tax=Natronobiforma cellulositropha TaxID=1679076 RepID=UPI0021D58E1F|nr:glucose 1-dehydrogenase [Natronobiforma cellulositropha]
MDLFDRLDLTGEVAIVTGGSRGIGYGVAHALAEAGARVVITNRDAASGASAAATIEADTDASVDALGADVSDEAAVEALVDHVRAEHGTVDVLVNNAGIVHNVPAEAMTREEWRAVLEVNLTGAFHCAKHVGRVMIADGGGSIVNLSSISAFVANHPQPQVSYQASKGGMDAMTRQLASEWAEHGVRVNSINPGYVRTDLIEDVLETDPEMAREWYDGMLLEEMARPEDVGPLAVYLASDASAYVTGQSVTIDGGYTVR